MKFFKYLVFIFIICAICPNLHAQQIESINEGSVDDQFEFAIKKSNNYNDANGKSYEVIRRSLFLNLKKNALDSLSAIQTKLDNTSNKVGTQQKEINTLQTNLTKIEDTLASTLKEKDSMTLFGNQMSKGSYKFLMWSIIAGLLTLLLIFIFKFKNSNAITKAAKNAQSNLEDEFKEHRRIAIEREQKVKRQLQDYINKNGA